jgi:hypothetical protein
MSWLMVILIFRLPRNAARFFSSIPARSASQRGISASYGLLNEGQLQVLALDDNQVIAEVAIYP